MSSAPSHPNRFSLSVTGTKTSHRRPPPWTIRGRLDRPHHDHATYAYVGGVQRRDPPAGLLPPVISVITIPGIGDHLQPEWLITFTGMRTDASPRRVCARPRTCLCHRR